MESWENTFVCPPYSSLFVCPNTLLITLERDTPPVVVIHLSSLISPFSLWLSFLILLISLPLLIFTLHNHPLLPSFFFISINLFRSHLCLSFASSSPSIIFFPFKPHVYSSILFYIYPVSLLFLFQLHPLPIFCGNPKVLHVLFFRFHIYSLLFFFSFIPFSFIYCKHFWSHPFSFQPLASSRTISDRTLFRSFEAWFQS